MHILRSYNLYNLLMLVYVLYANEIFCYISFSDKTRSRLQNDDLNVQIHSIYIVQFPWYKDTYDLMMA